MTPEIIGLAGGAVGVLGGIIGTYFSIHNTKTSAERRFMWRASICVWLGIGLFLAALYFLPAQWKWVPWGPYAIALSLSIRYINTHARFLRESDRNA